MTVEAHDRIPDPDLPARLFLDLEGRRVPLQIRRQSRERSDHTGRSLVELHAWVITADVELHRWLAGVLSRRGDRATHTVDEAGEVVGKWRVSWNAYGEKAGVHTYTLILRECEELTLEALLLDGLELHPYEYREEVVGERLAIWMKLVGTEEDVQRLRELMGTQSRFSVIRRGIQDEPREMRVGVAQWAEWEDRIKYRLVLLETGIDELAHGELARVERENSRAAIGFYMNLAERLLALLQQKGVLSADELEALRESARADPVVVRRDFWQIVADIDEL